MSESEEWRLIPSAPNYQASSLGRIRQQIKGNVLKGSLHSSGYMKVVLRTEGRSMHRSVHRMVAEAFLPAEPGRPTVNHKNHVRDDNRLSNLERMSTIEQNRHSIKKPQGQHGRPVWMVSSADGTDLARFPTAQAAATYLGKKTAGHIINSIRNNTMGYGYFWRYDGAVDGDLPSEKWQALACEYVKGINGFQISSQGRLRNKFGRTSRGSKNANGYLRVDIGGKEFLLHRLVALTFISKVPGADVVNHIDGNKENAAASNLEWLTPAQNSRHAVNAGLTTNRKPVIQYTMTGQLLASYPSIVFAMKKTDVDDTNIWAACNGIQQSAGGFRWAYES